MKIKITILAMLLSLCLLAACAAPEQPPEPAAEPPAAEQQPYVLTVHGDGIEGELIFTFDELLALPDAEFSHAYSAINNWPTSRFYAAQGVKISAILETAGVSDTAQTVVFRSADGYEAKLTRSQLLDTPQYYYPQPGEADQGAEQVFAIISRLYAEGSADMSEAAEHKPTLIIGQTNYLEHNNPAFVVGVDEIEISAAPMERWEPPTTFPTAGAIAKGETVKLQHSSFGLLKLHYTLDGSEPTALSPMYNPSTYQPELNKPLPIETDTRIKAIAIGYGKEPSEVAVFDFTVNE